MIDGEQLIQGGPYLKKSFQLQSQLLVKPVRFLTRSHVEPNNLENMKVCRATPIFSLPVIYLRSHSFQETRSAIQMHVSFKRALPQLIL